MVQNRIVNLSSKEYKNKNLLSFEPKNWDHVWEISFLFTNLYQKQCHLIQRHVMKTLPVSLILLQNCQNFQTFLLFGWLVTQYCKQKILINHDVDEWLERWCRMSIYWINGSFIVLGLNFRTNPLWQCRTLHPAGTLAYSDFCDNISKIDSHCSQWVNDLVVHFRPFL